LARLPRAALAAWTTIALVGCSSGNEGAPAAESRPIGDVASVDRFIGALAAAMCDWQFRCCSLPEVDYIGSSSYLTPSECRPMTELQLRTQLGELRGAVFTGRMGLDSKVAASCVANFSEGSCATLALPQDPWTRLAECLDPFVGQVPAGAPCRLRDECETGSLCVPGGTGARGNLLKTPEGLSAPRKLRYAGSVTGACLTYASEGELCRDFGDCAPGLYCRADTSVCARPALEGEPCQSADPNGLPAIERPCDDADGWLTCRGGMCGRLPQSGEPCLGDGAHPPCDPDPSLALVCVGARFNGPGVCQPRASAGQACGSDGLAPCDIGLTCNGADGVASLGTCGPAPVAGASCAFPSACGFGAVCDSDTVVCAAGKALRDGMACATGADCASLVCSESAPGVGGCASPVLVRIACTGEAPAAPPTSDGGAAP
jgi:hypothetical protein